MRWRSQGKNLTFTEDGRAVLLIVPLFYADTESIIPRTGYDIVEAIL